jgi:hypothetical protein
MRPFHIATVAFGLLGSAAQFGAVGQVPAYVPPNDMAECTDWTKKLENGVEVIGATASRIAEARKQLETAKRAQTAGQWYSCSQAAAAGIRSLNAG